MLSARSTGRGAPVRVCRRFRRAERHLGDAQVGLGLDDDRLRSAGPSGQAVVLLCTRAVFFYVIVITPAINRYKNGDLSNVTEQIQALFTCYCCSGAQSCPTLCDPMNCSTPGLPVHHQLPEFAQVHVHCIGDAVQPSHPLMPSSPYLHTTHIILCMTSVSFYCHIYFLHHRYRQHYGEVLCPGGRTVPLPSPLRMESPHCINIALIL